MSVKLKIDGITKEREVTSLSYAFSQNYDIEGRPSATVRGGTVNISIKSQNDGNTDFFTWACDPYTSKNGTIEFEDRAGTNMKKMELKEIYLVAYNEIFSSVDGDFMGENFVLSSKSLKVGDVEHINKWPEKK